jgi:hypothetical protein
MFPLKLIAAGCSYVVVVWMGLESNIITPHGTCGVTFMCPTCLTAELKLNSCCFQGSMLLCNVIINARVPWLKDE